MYSVSKYVELQSSALRISGLNKIYLDFHAKNTTNHCKISINCLVKCQQGQWYTPHRKYRY